MSESDHTFQKETTEFPKETRLIPYVHPFNYRHDITVMIGSKSTREGLRLSEMKREPIMAHGVDKNFYRDFAERLMYRHFYEGIGSHEGMDSLLAKLKVK